MVDVNKGAKAKIRGEQYLVCNETCKGFAEKANQKQMKELLG